MKNSEKIPLLLYCNTFLANPKDLWIEVVDLGFIEHVDKHITISRLAYAPARTLRLSIISDIH